MSRRMAALHPRRGFIGGALAALAIALALRPFDTLPDAVPALALVLPVLYGAVAGGRRAAIGVALVAAVAFAFQFILPAGSFLIDTIEGFVALAVFVAVAVVVGSLVAREAGRRRDAEAQRDEIERMHERFKVLTAERERLADDARRVEVLEAIDRQRAALLRSVSHDLRSPLATIRGVSSDLRDRATLDEATRRRLLGLVVSESERLDRIVANLLSLSRIEAGAFEPDREPVDVEEMIERSVARLGRLFEDRPLRVDVPAGLPFADADATQIDQVIANLLENAARHTPPGTHTVVSAALDGDGMVRISIADDGPGFATAFEPRPGSGRERAGRAPSTSVGLTICRAIVEAHGGTLCIDSTPGAGTRVSFTIPPTGRAGGG
jgi:two-component system sensor histidine kinase KdpD